MNLRHLQTKLFCAFIIACVPACLDPRPEESPQDEPKEEANDENGQNPENEDPSDGASPEEEGNPLSTDGISIDYPPPRSLTERATITLRGRAWSDEEIGYVQVNGVNAVSEDGFAHWQATVDLQRRLNSLVVNFGNADGALEGTDTVVVDYAGPKFCQAFRPQVHKHTGTTAGSSSTGSLIADTCLRALFLIEENGFHTMLSGSGVPNSETPLAGFDDIIAHGAYGYLIADRAQKRILAVSAVTGQRTVISDSTSNGTPFSKPVSLHAGNSKIYVADKGTWPVIFEVDPATGTRSLLTSNYQSSGGGTVSLESPQGVVLSSDENTLYISDSENQALIQVDLLDGEATTLSDNSLQDSEPYFVSPRYIWIDGQQDIIVEDEGRLIRVDRSTGIRFDEGAIPSRLLEGDELQTPDSNTRLDRPTEAVFDAEHQRYLVADPALNAIVAIDPETGARSELSNAVSDDEFMMAALVIDAPRNRALVLDHYNAKLIAVSLSDGDVSPLVLSGESMSEPRSMAIDSSNNRVFVGDVELDSVFEIDLLSGDVLLLSAPDDQSIEYPLSYPSTLVFDSGRQRLLVADSFRNDIFAVSLMAENRGEQSFVYKEPFFGDVELTGMALDENADNLVASYSGGDLARYNFEQSSWIYFSSNTFSDDENIVFPGVGNGGHEGNALLYPEAVMLVPDQAYILVPSRGWRALMAVDRLTGDRVVFSR